jgi:molecular chaperone GrpE
MFKMKHGKENKENQEKSTNPFAEEKEQTEEKEVLKEEAETEASEAPKEEESSAQDELQKKYDELNNQYVRLAADFDNFRKRQAQERENLINYGAENAMKKLIEVLDNFDRAKVSIAKTEDINQVKDSFEVLYKQIFDNLSKLGLEVIEAQGKEFDPNFHEAIMQTPTSEHPENSVIAELQKGYKLGDKVLRPALVNVATEEG